MSATLAQRYSLMYDFGNVIVPQNYEHGNWLAGADVRIRSQGSLYYRDHIISDAGYSNPSRILLPGEVLRVRAFRQVDDFPTSSTERLEFLKSMNAVFPGVQGASLVLEQMSPGMTRDLRYESFDDKDHLYKNPCLDEWWLPIAYFSSNGDRSLRGVRFDQGFPNHAFFCFNEVW